MNTGANASDDLLTRGLCEKCGKELTRYHKFWECESQHTICNNCFADQIHDDLANISCPRCAKNLKAIKPLNASDEHVFIYVDDSNMWIEAKKLAAVKAKLKCVEDPGLRLDIGKVTDVVANGREVALGTLYGSEPPPIDTVWKKIRERGWKVITTKRSTYTRKEKQVDHQMVADITALVSDRSVAKGKVVMVSGDADMIPAINECLKMKWSVEIWMWDSGTSNAIKELADENPELVNIISLDLRLEDVTFTNFKFGEKKIPQSRSLIIKKIDFSPDAQWQKKLSEKLGWQFQSCMIGQEGMDNPVEYKDIILIFANVKSVDGKNVEEILPAIFEKLKIEYPGRIVNYPAYRGQFDQQADICIANRFEALESVNEQLSVNSTSSEYPSYKHGEDRETGFQVVENKTPKPTQKYSFQCPDRSNCRYRLKCNYQHTDDEKNFFKQWGKDRECWNKGHCPVGPTKCHFAHSDKDSFCRNCHSWGHLQKKCTKK